MNGRAIGAGLLTAAALVALGALPAAAAEGLPAAPTPEQAASAPQTLDTLSRFFARDGALARSAAAPSVEGGSVPVRILSPDFVAGKAGAPVARVEFRASRAVAADGRKASLWTVKQPAGWQVVNIATGDDEIRYAEQGGRVLPGGLVFREPQIDAWYVQKGAKVLPLDEDAVRAVGKNGTSLAAYRERVAEAYGDKLPGSAYAKKGAAGGYAPQAAVPARPQADAPAPHEDPAVTTASTAAGAGAVLALALIGTTAIRRRRAARES
ncbi:hypothetical protein DEJ46_30110 [Streptomyces venezuelae]|uniref:Uncharacterized protein n=2 Tax=Streptomyces TaxID=1883 RepID=A0A5P2B3I6_STRVZ|nr:hypothetical protein [Streptomyces venezuelae]QES24876.1 hypothetical protein DEJ46_30110 [Streptomyces venezuelae]